MKERGSKSLAHLQPKGEEAKLVGCNLKKGKEKKKKALKLGAKFNGGAIHGKRVTGLLDRMRFERLGPAEFRR